jgi:hypothetical protein
MKKLPAAEEDLKEREALRLRLVKESMKSIEKSGVNIKGLTALRASHYDKTHRLYNRTIGKGKVGTEIPKPKNVDYFIPYHFENQGYSSYKSERGLPNPSHTRYLDNSTGYFGSRTFIHVSGADSWDLVSVTSREMFDIIYFSPNAGLPAINIDLEAVQTYYQGSIHDECGVSSARVRQNCRLFGVVYTGSGARTYHPTHLHHVHWTGRDGYFSDSVLVVGTDFNMSFVISDPVPADTYALLGVGIETHNEFLSDDCTVYSTVDFGFLARRIGITTAT